MSFKLFAQQLRSPLSTLLPFPIWLFSPNMRLNLTTAVEGTITLMRKKISLWRSARRPVPLTAMQPDNARLSIYIRGILILFLCLGRGSWGGWGQGYCECFSSRETEVRPTRLWLGKRPQNIGPRCHSQQPRRFWTFFLRVTAPCCCGFCSRRLRP